jgi:aspartate/glutamate racemase
VDIPIFDTTKLHVLSAVDYALQNWVKNEKKY